VFVVAQLKLFVLVRVVDVDDNILIPPATPLTTKLPPLKLAALDPVARPLMLKHVGTIENEGDDDDDDDDKIEEEEEGDE